MVAVVLYSLVPPFVPLSAGWLRPKARLLLPLAYLVAIGIGIFLLLALYVPLFELS